MCFLGNIVSIIFTPEEPMVMFIALTVLASISAVMYLFGYNSPPIPMESTKEVMLSGGGTSRAQQLGSHLEWLQTGL